MDPLKAKAAHGPEWYVQNLWVEFLEAKSWHVERMIGNAFQKGIPDLFMAHPKYGQRWVDIKVYGRYSFTKAQKLKWPLWEKAKIGIWIIGAKSQEACTKIHMIEEHKLLLQPPNWREFWKDSWDKKPDIDAMMEELNNEANSN